MSTHQPIINLVCTRCSDGNHFALQRWYADHVHLLLAAPQLQQAQLFRCAQPLEGEPPQYVCMYEFADYPAFEAFEHGEAKVRATELTNAATGRSSISIVQRMQYARMLHRQWPAHASSHSAASSPSWRLVASFECEDAWSLAAERWLGDHLQALHACSPLMAAQVYVSDTNEPHGFVALDFAGGDAQDVWQLLRQQLTQDSLYGQALASLRFHWAAKANWLQSWLR
jgi:hypothetical protein